MVVLPESLGQELSPGVRKLRTGSSFLRAVNPSELPQWNRWLELHPESGVFHTAEWISVLTETYRFRPACLLWEQDQGVPSMLPFVEVDLWGRARKGVALPFTDLCQPLFSDSTDRELIWQKLVEHGQHRSWRFLELRGGGEFIPASVPSMSFLGHSLQLERPLGQIFQGFDGAVRQAIRKAEREGVQAEVSESPEALEEYYQLHCLTRQRHGLPPQPIHLFRNIYKNLIAKGLGWIVTARFQGRPVAAGIYFSFAGKALFKFGASDLRFQSVRGNDLVMWKAIQTLVNFGCRVLHFGRTSLGNQGLRRFKLQWGGQETKIAYHKYDLRNGRFVCETDRALGWHNHLFRWTPIWLARLAGSLLYGQTA